MTRKSTDNDEQAERPDKIGERVAKVIARAGFGSRRDGEEMIAAGRVAINGTVIDTPAVNVTPGDRVTIDGKPLPERERTRLFLYHKPRGLVTSHNDPQGRPTVFAALPKHLPRLLSVGRLDFNTEGLLLLTNDGGLARILELPDTGWLRRYRVRAHGEVNQAQLDELRGGVTVDDMHYGPIEARLDRVQGTNAWITIGIREGKNREVRNVLSHLGLQVTRLIRVSFGPFQLGDLPEGEVEEVKTRVLREQLGERVAEEAGVDFSGPLVERDEAPRRERGDRSERDEGPERRGRREARGDRWPDHSGGREPRRGERGERGERDERGGRREGRFDRDERRGPARDGQRPGRDEAAESGRHEPRRHGPKSSHVWRQHDEFSERPKRKGAFRGQRRDEGEHSAPTGEKTAGLVADRKGRQVLVERFATVEPDSDGKVRIPKEPKRFGKGMRREHPAEAGRRAPERSGRPGGPRRERFSEGGSERAFGPNRERGERSFGPKRERSFGSRDERPSGPRRERSFEGRGERSSGPNRERGERSFGPKRERSERSFGPKRERSERSFGPKRERSERSFGPKRDGGGRRPDRPPRSGPGRPKDRS